MNDTCTPATPARRDALTAALAGWFESIDPTHEPMRRQRMHAVRAALSRLGRAGLADADYTSDCLHASVVERDMGSLVLLCEALREVADRPALEPVVV